MIVFGAGEVASAAPRLYHLRIKGSLADGVAEMCNFAVFTVAAAAVEVSYGGVIANISGAGIAVFGSAGVLVHGVSFVAWILLRRIKERFRKDWKDCFCHIEKARLFELGRNAKNICSKLREIANTLDRHHQNVQTAKIIGSGAELAGEIAGAAGAVVTLATGRLAAPLVVGGAAAFGAGIIIKSGASKAEEIIERNTLEALQEEWDGFQTLLGQTLEALQKKSPMYTAELNKDILSLFKELGSTLLIIKEGSTNSQKTESADKNGGCVGKFETKMIPFVQMISVSFVDLVSTAVQLDIKRKTKITFFFLKLACDLEKLGTRLCEDGDQRNSKKK